MSIKTVLNGKIDGGGSSGLTGDYTQAGIWMLDYKAYGEDSYVFLDKRIWKAFLESPIAVNDPITKDLSLNWIKENGGHAGKVIGSMYGIRDANWDSLESFDDIINDYAACNAALNYESTSEFIFKYMTSHKTLQELDTDVYIELIKNSLYGKRTKETEKTNFNKPALLLNGISNISSNIENRSVGYNILYLYIFAESGFYWNNLNGDKIICKNSAYTGGSIYKANEVTTIDSEGVYTQPYSKTSYDINHIVSSLPSQSNQYSRYTALSNVGSYCTSTTVSASYTYIPL